ncbi:MAG: pyridoxamine 5'-phosphate oxidase family protein [Clostridium sp.]
MIIKNEFTRIMETQTEIALATSNNNEPNVRIVNYYYDITANTLFFTTFGDNDKVKEFEANPNIAFTTIPPNGNEHIKAQGIVQKSDYRIFDIADKFISKIDGYKDTIDEVGEYLVLYEVKFKTAKVILDLENIHMITL